MTQNDHQTEGMTHYVGGETIFFLRSALRAGS